jgi:hypothetical protein
VVSGDQPVKGNPSIVVTTTPTDLGEGDFSYDDGRQATDDDLVVSLGEDRYANAATFLQGQITSTRTLGFAWSKVSGLGELTFDKPTARKVEVQASEDGTYVIRVVVKNSSGATGTDDVQVTWDSVVPTVDAGAPIFANRGEAPLAVVTDATPVVYDWEQVSGPGSLTFADPHALTTEITATAEGSYEIRLSVSDSAGNLAADDTTFVWDVTAPAVEAGVGVLTNGNAALDATVTDASATSVEWTKVSGPGEVTFAATSTVDTTASTSADGTYVFRLTATDAAGNVAFDEVTVVKDASAPVVSAGDDLTARFATTLAATVTDLSAVTAAWTKISGPGTVLFGDAAVSNTTVAADADGAYVLRLTVTDALGQSASDDTTFVWDTTLPVVDAGSDVTTATTASQDASVTDDTATLYAWTKISGPGALSFGSPTSEDTTIAASQDGTYTVRLTATDGAGNAASDEIVFVKDSSPPVIDAGSDVTSGSAISRNATVSDATATTYLWSKVSGPGSVTFGSPNAEDTTIVPSIDGSYVIRLTATDAAGNSAHDDFSYLLNSAAPTVDAGPDVGTSTPALQDATVTGNGTITYQWTKVSGPGSISFGSPTAVDTTIAAGAEGTYVLRLTATNDSELSAFDEITFVWDGTPPVVDAGTDEVAKSLVSHQATVTDISTLTYAWSAVSGPGTVTFGNAGAEDTTLSASATGVYVVRLTATDTAGNSSFDELSLTWDLAPPAVDAGPDVLARATTAINATTSDLTTRTFAWTKLSGPGTVTFGSASAEDTTASASTGGTYVLRLTVTDQVGNVASDDVTLTWDVTPPTVDAGTDKVATTDVSQDASASDTGSMTYQWTRQSGPGTLTFGSQTAEDTTISASSDGVYVVRLTVTDAAGNSAFDDMTYTRDTTPPTISAGPDLAGSSSTLADATVTDLTSLTYAWSQISGPGTVGFGSGTAQDTTLVASLYGTYVVRLTATDAAGNAASDELTFKWVRFSLGWSFDLDADYAFDGDKVVVVGGAAKLVPVALASSVDQSAGDFNAGAHANTAYAGTGVQLNAAGLTAKTGTFTSRIFDAGATVNWNSISWTADRPYQKDLPNGGGVEDIFDNGNADMTDNILLYHFNETSGTTFADGSSYAHAATCTACPTANAAGKIAKSATFSASHLVVPNSSALNPGGNMTFAVWVKPTATNGYILEKGNNDTTDSYAFFFYGGKLAFEANDSSGTYRYHEAGTITANVWTHVAAVFNDTTNQLTFYKDGVQVGSPISVAYSLNTTYTNPLYIGKQSYTNNDIAFPGQMDELAIFSRALSAAEILKIYQRGAVSMKLQVRGCADATCSAAPAFVGPDGTSATFFDNYPVAGQGAAWTISGITGVQYLQYRATLDTYANTISPVLKTVSFAQFLNSSPDLTTNSGYPYTALVGFDDSTGPSHLGTVYYQLSADGSTWYYHDGTTWAVASATVSEANTVGTVNAKISSFHSVAGPGTIMVRAFLNATGGAETIELLDVTVTGDNANL